MTIPRSRRFTEYNRYKAKLFAQGNELFVSRREMRHGKENPFIVRRDTRDEAWEFTWKIALGNHGEVQNFPFRIFIVFPACICENGQYPA